MSFMAKPEISPKPLPLSQVLAEEFVEIHGSLPESFPAGGSEDERITALYAAIHGLKEPRSALCLSGGGIRSATFSLGVLQGLARAGLLPRFHYISTVSGGGYIGSWLSSWIHRHRRGAAGVFQELASSPPSRLETEPKPVERLRAYSNYLTPRLGLLSADTWSMVGTILRNLTLNWLLLVPMLLILLALPRVYLAFVFLPMFVPESAPPELLQWIFLVLGGLAAIVSLAAVGIFRPSSSPPEVSKPAKEIPRQGIYLGWCILPLLLGAVLLTICHGWNHALSIGRGEAAGAGVESNEILIFVIFGILLNLAGWGAYSLRVGPRLWELCVVLATGAAGGLCIFATVHFLSLDSRLYTCLAVPAGILSFLVAATLFVGLMSRQTNDEDREWWARFGGWLLMASVGWAALSSVAIFGPDLMKRAWFSLGSLGGLSGIATLILGRSALTGAQAGASRGSGGWRSLLPEWTLNLAAPLFMIILLAALAWGWDGLIVAAGMTPPGRILVASPVRLLLVLMLLLALFLFFFAWLIDPNKFSLHSMYRSRLIRAYLGASHAGRRPNGFTGFDPADNLLLQELQAEAFHVRDLTDPGALFDRWRRKDDPVSAWLKAEAPSPLREQLKNGIRGVEPEAVAGAMVEGLNALCADLTAGGQVLRLADGKVAPDSFSGDRREALRRNRAFLREAFKREIAPAGARGPFQVINCALNLVRSENLAWQERKSQSFIMTPLHSGSCAGVGYRQAFEYGGERGASLGTAMAISGAAVSPNMGYHSSPLVTFLLTFFNARLGWWLGNPRSGGKQPPFRRNCPRFALVPLVRELLGLTDAESSYVYLSDGGHFENLGLYEMVRRRCRIIFAVDAGCDPEFKFEDLGNAVRKIRTDLGVEIEFKELGLAPRSSSPAGARFALGRIGYSDADRAKDADGILVYIKPLLTGDEPADVLNYSRTNPAFPHEPTADQWFSESQFESYRALGQHIVEKLGGQEGEGGDPFSLLDSLLGGT
jgi:hypothetical protein